MRGHREEQRGAASSQQRDEAGGAAATAESGAADRRSNRSRPQQKGIDAQPATCPLCRSAPLLLPSALPAICPPSLLSGRRRVIERHADGFELVSASHSSSSGRTDRQKVQQSSELSCARSVGLLLLVCQVASRSRVCCDGQGRRRKHKTPHRMHPHPRGPHNHARGLSPDAAPQECTRC